MAISILGLVSVIMPAYNAAEFIVEAVESMIAQTYSHWELIIIDDGSTDNTFFLLKKYLLDPRITYKRQENQGQASARNCGVELSSGEYIAFLDADDLFMPNKIAVCLSHLSPEVDVVYSSMELIDRSGNHISFFDSSRELSRKNFLAEMFFRNLVLAGTTLFKKVCMEKECFFEGMRMGEDYDLFMRWAHKFTFAYTNIPLIKYRRHGQSTSAKMDTIVKLEKELVRSYGISHLRDVVEQSDYSREEKTLLLAKILVRIDAYEEGIKALEELNEPLAFFYIGNCCLALNRNDKAKEAYLQSLHLNLEDAASYNNLGVAYARVGEEAKAKESFQMALQLVKGYRDPQHNLGLLEGKFSVEQLRITERELRKTLQFYST